MTIRKQSTSPTTYVGVLQRKIFTTVYVPTDQSYSLSRFAGVHIYGVRRVLVSDKQAYPVNNDEMEKPEIMKWNEMRWGEDK